MHMEQLGSVAISLEQARHGKEGRLADLAVFEQLLALLLAHDLPPEKFDLYDDPDSRKRNVPFDVEHFMRLLADSDAHALPMFFRRAAPSYEFLVGSLVPRFSPSARFSGSGPRSLEDLFRFADDLCVLFQPVYGGLAFDWSGESEQVTAFNQMPRTCTIHRYGFESAAVRNYVEPEIRNRFDFMQFQDLDAHLVELPWNAVRIDLTWRPRDASFDILYRQMQRINSSLAAQGLKGDYSRSLLRKPEANCPAVSVP